MTNPYIERIHIVREGGAIYLGFSPDVKDESNNNEQIRRTFTDRFGYEPDEVIVKRGGRLVGPIRLEYETDD